jgi:hypothetical protein
MRGASALVLGCGLAACGAPATTTVCDDSDAVRLAVRYQPVTALAPGEHVLYDNGASFLFVDGACTYHVKTGSRWDDVVRGTADDATLVDELELDQLAGRAGTFTGDLPAAPTLRIAFEGAAITCAAGCSGGDVPDWLHALNTHAAALLTDLHAAGFTQTIAQRVLVVAEPVPATPAFVWPASFDPATISVVPDDADTAPATLVDGDDADALRALRRAVRDAQFPPAAAYVTTDETQPPSYAAFVRDALPHEDADGIVADP